MATMKLIAGSLIVVVALLVGVGSMAALIPRTWSLIKHPVPSEELTHEELLTELEKITYDVRNRWKKGSGPPEFAERVASLLYKTEDKNSVQIVNGVSVAKLIEQNSFNGLEECSEEALKKRARAMAETNGTTLGIDIYVFECIHNAIKYCLEHKEKVVEEEINNRQWLDVLGDKLWDDLYQEENKQKAKRSALIDYIQWVPEDSLAEKDVGIEEQVDYDGTLMEHPEPSEELSREELMAQLGRLRPSNKEPRVEFFVDKLYKSKAKATTEVINGVTVEQLIDANQFNGLNDCSRESLRQRSEIFFRTQPNKNLGPGWVSDGDQVANAYVLECLFRLARYCYDNREEVVSMGINDEDWLGELGRRSVDSSIRNKFNYYFGGNAPELIYFMKFQPSDDALIPHPPEPSEELTKLELFALLDDEWFGFNIPEFTVEYLYKTQQKESSLVMNGVSVANLIELNSFTGGLNECSKVALKERARVVEEVERRLEPEVNKMMFKLNVYALHCLHKAAKYCFEHKNEVVERGINEEQWLKRLRKNIWKEKNIVNNIYEGYPDSTLARYITNAQ